VLPPVPVRASGAVAGPGVAGGSWAGKDAAAIFSDNEYNNILVYSSYSEFLLNEAKCQLAQMKSDILKAIVRNKPFYGVLTALLAVSFRDGPENWILTPQFTEKILSLLKDAVDFFLSTFSTKTSNTGINFYK